MGGTIYDKYEELLQQDLDVVYVATPDHLHVEYAKAVLEAGKHLFLEKAIATTLEDGAEIAAAADKHPELISMMGYPHLAMIFSLGINVKLASSSHSIREARA